MEIRIFFLVGITFLLIHEMDAVRCKEWTIFPFLSRLNDNAGYIIFTTAHIPLLLLLFLGFANGAIFNPGIRMGLDVFLILHVFLHGFFHRHPKNQFTSLFTWFIIMGTGLAGLLDLGVILK
jgi:hypothetical protein